MSSSDTKNEKGGMTMDQLCHKSFYQYSKTNLGSLEEFSSFATSHFTSIAKQIAKELGTNKSFATSHFTSIAKLKL